MAPSKPLPDNHDGKKLGQQTRQYLPATPSPLSPRSSKGRPASLPRRHTVSGPTPTTSTTASETAAATSVPTRSSKKHKRRHSGSVMSPTERLMRYKGALAWRSATTNPSPSPTSGEDISPLRRNPIQLQCLGPPPNSENSTTTHKEGPRHNVKDTDGAGHQWNTSQNRQKQLQEHRNEKSGSHFIVQVEEPSVTVTAQAQPAAAKDTTARKTPYHQRDYQAAEYPYHYQYGGYGTNYPTTSNMYDKDHLNAIISVTASDTTTTLQRAALIAASVFFSGVYISICAFVLTTARRHDLSISVDT